jgi:hypothetical protein
MPNWSTVLGARNLSGLVQNVVPGVPKVLPDEWFKPTRTVPANMAEWFDEWGSRLNSGYVPYGGTARLVPLRSLGTSQSVLYSSLEKISLRQTEFMNLLATASEGQGQTQKFGREELVRQAVAFSTRRKNMRTTLPQLLLLTGSANFDDKGQIQPAPTQTGFTMSANIPAANLGHVVDVSNAVIKVPGGGAPPNNDTLFSWEQSGTDIYTQLAQLKVLARQRSGHVLTEAFYGTGIPGLLANNANATKWLQFYSAAQQATGLMGEIPPGFMGFDWHPVGEAFYSQETAVPANNTGAAGTSPSGVIESITSYMPSEGIVFSPKPARTWYDFVEGTTPIPKDMGKIVSGVEEAQALFDFMVGEWMFGKIEGPMPARIDLYSGDVFSPQIRVPSAVYITTPTGT